MVYFSAIPFFLAGGHEEGNYKCILLAHGNFFQILLTLSNETKEQNSNLSFISNNHSTLTSVYFRDLTQLAASRYSSSRYYSTAASSYLNRDSAGYGTSYSSTRYESGSYGGGSGRYTSRYRRFESDEGRRERIEEESSREKEREGEGAAERKKQDAKEEREEGVENGEQQGGYWRLLLACTAPTMHVQKCETKSANRESHSRITAQKLTKSKRRPRHRATVINGSVIRIGRNSEDSSDEEESSDEDGDEETAAADQPEEELVEPPKSPTPPPPEVRKNY